MLTQVVVLNNLEPFNNKKIDKKKRRLLKKKEKRRRKVCMELENAMVVTSQQLLHKNSTRQQIELHKNQELHK
jgi:hypothetical protein